MKKMNILNVKPGMMVARPVYSGNGVCLVAENFILNEKNIERIKHFNLDEIWINDEYNIITNYLKNELNIRVIKCYESTSTPYTSKKVTLDERRLETVSCLVNAVVDSVIKDIECISLLAEIKSASDDMYMHSVDVARISLITGINMNFNVSELVNLCKAALLHDIGKLEFLKKAPNYIKEHPYEYKRHHLLGYEKLKQSNNFETSVYVSVLQHHERYDGNGYPRGMKGINITIFAKIISIADFYANMLQAAERKYSKSEILEVLYADFSKQFDPKILSIFVSKFPLYEIGEIVSLSTGDTAIVVQNNEECIARPIVRVLNKNKELGSEINLFKTLNITIL